jgi:hypothetical protein
MWVKEVRRVGEGGDAAVYEAVMALDGGSRAALIAHAPKLAVLWVDEVRRVGGGIDVEGGDAAVYEAVMALDARSRDQLLRQPKVRDQLLVDLRVLEKRNAGAGANAFQLISKHARICILAGGIDIIEFYLRSASAAVKLAGPCSSASIVGHVVNGLTASIDEKTDGKQVSSRWLVSRCSVCMQSPSTQMTTRFRS